MNWFVICDCCISTTVEYNKGFDFKRVVSITFDITVNTAILSLIDQALNCTVPDLEHGIIRPVSGFSAPSFLTVGRSLSGYVPIDSKVQLSCETGYVLSGKGTLTCGRFGMMTETIPTCSSKYWISWKGIPQLFMLYFLVKSFSVMSRHSLCWFSIKQKQICLAQGYNTLPRNNDPL